MHRAVSAILLEAAVRALVIAIALWLGIRLLRVANAMAQKAAWTMVLCAAIAMPLLMRWQWLPAWTAVHLPVASWSQWPPHASRTAPVASASSAAREQLPMDGRPDAMAADRFAAPVSPLSAVDEPANAAPEAVETPAMPHPVQQEPAPVRSLAAWLFDAGWLLYFGVTIVLLFRLVMGVATSVRLWSRAGTVTVATELSAPPGVAVRWSGKIASPVNIGSGVLLPADYSDWDDEKLRVVLAHETSHIEQRDFYLQLMAGLYAAVIWFSPLGWWLKRKLADLGETISDRAALKAAASPAAYAELLLEFAARPRPTLAGVAMAHSTNLHQRIERLLNEASFSRVFAGKGRSAIAFLLPGVLIAAVALVRVQAAAVPAQTALAQATSSPHDATQSSARTEQSQPEQEQVTDTNPGAPPQAATPEPSPAPTPTPKASPTPEADSGPYVFMEPIPHFHIAPKVIVRIPPLAPLALINPIQLDVPSPFETARGGHGDTYRVFGGEEYRRYFDGDLSADCEAAAGKTRQGLQGQVLFVCHEGKPYVIDDPAAIAQINEIDKEMNDKSEQMKALGKQLRDDSRQVREEARKAREAAEKVPKPDITKEVAELDAAAADLKADQDGNVSREQLMELQRKLSEVQRRLISTEVKVEVNSVAMSQMSAEQGKFGEQMGKLGSEMGQLAHERDQKIRSIIDESLKNGRAKPVN